MKWFLGNFAGWTQTYVSQLSTIAERVRRMSAVPLLYHFVFFCLFAVPSADELRRMMMLHGGQFHLYYTRSKTTHIIATNLPNSKIQELRGEKVVRPEWITDRCDFCALCKLLKHNIIAILIFLFFVQYKGRLPTFIHPVSALYKAERLELCQCLCTRRAGSVIQPWTTQTQSQPPPVRQYQAQPHSNPL